MLWARCLIAFSRRLTGFGNLQYPRTDWAWFYVFLLIIAVISNSFPPPLKEHPLLQGPVFYLQRTTSYPQTRGTPPCALESARA